MTTRVIAILMTGALAHAPTLARASQGDVTTVAAATRADGTSSTVRLVVDTSALLEDERANVQQWILEDGANTLAEAGVTVVDSDAELEIRVAAMPEGVGYVVEAGVWRAGVEQPEIRRDRKVCQACNRTELVAMVDLELMWLGGWLAERDPGAAQGDTAGSGDSHPSQPGEPASQTHDGNEPKRSDSKRLRNAGLGLAIGGGLTLGGGIALVAVGRRSVDPGLDFDLEERNYRPPGIAIAAIGGAAAVAGVVLLVIHARHKRMRTTAVMPALGPAGAGVMLRGRF